MSFTHLNDRDFTFKIIVFGDGNVGKTTLTLRLKFNRFKANLRKTIGVDFLSKTFFVDNLSINLQVWDFSGEDRFRDLFSMWLNGASGGIFMYDITNLDSLTHMNNWLEIVYRHYKPKDFPIVLVGGKSDLYDQRQVIRTVGVEVADRKGFSFFECSSKTGDNVFEIFQKLTEKVYFVNKNTGKFRKF